MAVNSIRQYCIENWRHKLTNHRHGAKGIAAAAATSRPTTAVLFRRESNFNMIRVHVIPQFRIQRTLWREFVLRISRELFTRNLTIIHATWISHNRRRLVVCLIFCEAVVLVIVNGQSTTDNTENGEIAQIRAELAHLARQLAVSIHKTANLERQVCAVC